MGNWYDKYDHKKLRVKPSDENECIKWIKEFAKNNHHKENEILQLWTKIGSPDVRTKEGKDYFNAWYDKTFTVLDD